MFTKIAYDTGSCLPSKQGVNHAIVHDWIDSYMEAFPLVNPLLYLSGKSWKRRGSLAASATSGINFFSWHSSPVLTGPGKEA